MGLISRLYYPQAKRKSHSMKALIEMVVFNIKIKMDKTIFFFLFFFAKHKTIY